MDRLTNPNMAALAEEKYKKQNQDLKLGWRVLELVAQKRKELSSQFEQKNREIVSQDETEQNNLKVQQEMEIYSIEQQNIPRF